MIILALELIEHCYNDAIMIVYALSLSRTNLVTFLAFLPVLLTDPFTELVVNYYAKGATYNNIHHT